ncbi:MAG: PQQ-binding-like beta-propeller repeat protein [Acidimicrobiia bacterium]|nr:PQQ-binding-like beta-propeller repeat protein [Acidimicrobiia bacterium]
MSRKPGRRSVIIAVLVLVVAACGSDEEPIGTGSADPSAPTSAPIETSQQQRPAETLPPGDAGATPVGIVYAIDAGSGQAVWQLEVPFPSYPWLQLAGDRLIYSGSGVPGPIAIDLDGRQLWQAPEGSRMQGPFFVDGGELIGVAEPGGSPFRSRVIALATGDGSQRWSHDFKWYVERGEAGAVSGSADLVFVAGQQGTLRALDRATGERSWQRRFDGRILDVAHTHEGTVYVGTTNGLVALDAQDRSILWSADTGGRLISSPEGISGGNAVSWIDSDREVGFDITAIDVVSGERIWTQSSYRQYHVGDEVVVGFVPELVSDHPRSVSVWDGGNGELIAEVAVGGRIAPFSVAITETTVYVGNLVRGSDEGSGKLVAIDLPTGEVSWLTLLRGSPGVPVVADGVVYVPSSAWWSDERGALHAVDAATGELLWTFDAPTEIRTAPITANGLVFVVSSEEVRYEL